jgi:hypothetical protein
MTLKKFLPLMSIIASIIIFTLILQFFQQGTLPHFMTNFMGFFFIVFGGFKIINWQAFAKAYQEYDLVAKQTKYYAYLYPLIEMGLGIAYLLRWQLFVINIITLVVMLIIAVGVANELLKGKEIICACLGVVFKIPMTWVTFAEDILMAFMALIMLIDKW